PRRRDGVEVLVAGDDLVVDQRPGPLAVGGGGPPGLGALRRGRPPAGGSHDHGQEERPGRPPAQRSSSAEASAGPSVPLARATSAVLMRSSRSPSRTRLTSPTSCFVRWSFTSWYGWRTYERIWLPNAMSFLAFSTASSFAFCFWSSMS